MIAGLLNTALPFALSAWAVLHLATGLTSILNATAALFGALVARAWLGERIHGLCWLGLLCGFTGVALLAWHTPDGQQAAGSLAAWAIAACLASSLCYGTAASFTRRYLSGIPALTTATGSQLGAFLALALPTWLSWPAKNPSLQAWLAIVAMAVLCTAIAYILYFRLIIRAGASRALTATFLAPVFALLYGSVFLQESLSAWMLVCTLIVLLGTVLSTGFLQLPRAQRAANKNN
jgi:drug/metabolite transporter (DMT)-like permease